MNATSFTIAATLALVVNGVAWGVSHDTRSKIAMELDNYARHLVDSGQMERAAEIEEYARTFRAAGRSTEGSVYLGFNPATVLTEYESALRESGQEKRADEVRHLARWYDCSNQYGFLVQRAEYEGLSKEETQAKLTAQLSAECRDILRLRTDDAAQAGSTIESPQSVQEVPQQAGPTFKKPGSGSGSIFKRAP